MRSAMVDGQPERVVLRLEHQMQVLNICAGDVPVEAVRLEVEAWQVSASSLDKPLAMASRSFLVIPDVDTMSVSLDRGCGIGILLRPAGANHVRGRGGTPPVPKRRWPLDVKPGVTLLPVAPQ